MMKYFFCKIFSILRVKNFLIIQGESEIKEIRLKQIPDIILIKEDGRYYNVIKTVSEIINDTLLYNWITVEEIKQTDISINDK